MSSHTHTENPGHLLLIIFAQAKTQKSLSRSGHRSVQKRKHHHNSSNHIVYPEILHPKYVQHHPRGIQRHRHDQQHTDVQHNRVFSYAAGIF